MTMTTHPDLTRLMARIPGDPKHPVGDGPCVTDFLR